MKIDQVIALQIEGENYSLGTVLRFANLQGKFDLIDDYITISLIATYADEHSITASQEEIRAAVTDWKMEKGMYQSLDTEKWLAERLLSTSDLVDFARRKILNDRVRKHVVSGKVEPYFADRRSLFDAVAFSQIVVNDRVLARELRFRTMEGAEFFSLARQYSIDESTRLAGGFVGRIERTQLPQAIAAHAFGVIPGTIAGPFEIDKKFYVVKIEEVYPAELNEATRARIEGILFEEWLSLRRKQANVNVSLWNED